MVGSKSDYGYNEAVYAASQKVAKDMPDVKVITADNIPENNAVTQTMQSMVDKGAKVIFATSYGYFSYAEKFAKTHPKVVVLHQGGFEKDAFAPNFGTYWGQAFEPVSLGGMAAGGVTKTNKLGYVYAFPISQTIANIDAFELGAQSVNPDAQTYLVNTSSWCDPLKQKEAAAALIGEGVDVLTQHQDCQATVIQAAKAAGYPSSATTTTRSRSTRTAGSPGRRGTGRRSTRTSPRPRPAARSPEASTTRTGSARSRRRQPADARVLRPSVPADLQAKITAEETALKKPGASVFTGPITARTARCWCGRRGHDVRPDQQHQLPRQGCRRHAAEGLTDDRDARAAPCAATPYPGRGTAPRPRRLALVACVATRRAGGEADPAAADASSRSSPRGPGRRRPRRRARQRDAPMAPGRRRRTRARRRPGAMGASRRRARRRGRPAARTRAASSASNSSAAAGSSSRPPGGSPTHATRASLPGSKRRRGTATGDGVPGTEGAAERTASVSPSGACRRRP